MASDLPKQTIAEAVKLATDLDSIRFPKGTRLRGERGGHVIILPNGNRYRLVPIADEEG